MVGSVVDFVESKNYKYIHADLPNYETPIRIVWKNTDKGHVPDVTGILNNILHIFEIETIDSINEQHAKDQWKLFATHAKQEKGKFIIVVPEGYKDRANDIHLNLQISAEIIEI